MAAVLHRFSSVMLMQQQQQQHRLVPLLGVATGTPDRVTSFIYFECLTTTAKAGAEVVVAGRPGGTARRPRLGPGRRRCCLRLRHGRGRHGGVLGDGAQRRLPRRPRRRRRGQPPAPLLRGRSGGGCGCVVVGRRRRRPARAPHEGEQLHLLICVRVASYPVIFFCDVLLSLMVVNDFFFLLGCLRVYVIE